MLSTKDCIFSHFYRKRTWFLSPRSLEYSGGGAVKATAAAATERESGKIICGLATMYSVTAVV